jgi:acetylornithine deacetylase/succinyl-diaminopimelate desuccinylase-like protein
MVAGNLNINILKEGVHSGAASGVVPSSFRILRLLLDRIEDSKTGEVIIPEAKVEIPEAQQGFVVDTAKVLGKVIHEEFPWVDGAFPVSDNLETLVTNRTWKATLCVTGFEGAPDLKNAGNVLRTHTNVKLSIRLPPSLDPVPFTAALKKVLETNPPYGAKVEFEPEKGARGWVAPPMASWLKASCEASSDEFFQKPLCGFGEGGTIPLMGMLSSQFPKSQFIITGVLGPGSNAHGPNEFLHIQMGKNLTKCCSKVLADHFLNTKAE